MQEEDAVKDVVMVMDTTVGRPAAILEGLAARGVTMVAACLFPRLEGRVAHVTVNDEDVETVREVASDKGALVLDAREVLVLDQAVHGDATAIARKISDAGAVVQVSYFGPRGEVIVATTDLDRARKGLGLDS